MSWFVSYIIQPHTVSHSTHDHFNFSFRFRSLTLVLISVVDVVLQKKINIQISVVRRCEQYTPLQKIKIQIENFWTFFFFWRKKWNSKFMVLFLSTGNENSYDNWTLIFVYVYFFGVKKNRSFPKRKKTNIFCIVISFSLLLHHQLWQLWTDKKCMTPTAKYCRHNNTTQRTVHIWFESAFYLDHLSYMNVTFFGLQFCFVNAHRLYWNWTWKITQKIKKKTLKSADEHFCECTNHKPGEKVKQKILSRSIDTNIYTKQNKTK